MGLKPEAILLNVVLPLRGHIVLMVNGLNRADVHAGGAIDAEAWVNVVLLVLIGGVDAVHRAHVNARGILHPDARLTDNIRHRLTPFDERLDSF